jgi:riboflavin synthase
MFTGIITDVGHVVSVRQGGSTRFEIATAWQVDGIDLGASIACSGACLTVVERGNGRFAVEVSAETLSKTTLGDWAAGTPINLERALKLGDELGGHMVAGHVDGTATLLERRPDGDSIRLVFAAPAGFARYVAPKGSITLDGVSLTVNEVDGERFGVNVIPHTLTATTLGNRVAGDRVNFEVDLLARYVARLLGPTSSPASP